MLFDSFKIFNDEYKGDFDLEITIKSGQTSQPPWKYDDGKYYEVFLINNVSVLVCVSQDKLNFPVNVEYYSFEKISKKQVKDKIFYIFDLNYNIIDVYNFLEEESKLQDVYKFNKGLRLFNAQYPFECIISSICSANNSIKRWTKSITEIKEDHGQKITLNNKDYYIFPTESEFLEISENKLKEHGVGYRSTYMIESTSYILQNPNFHRDIFDMSYSDAFNEINKLQGVGPKVADCILLYAYNKYEAYPVDVWINRITTYLYFNGKKPSNKQIMNFAQDKFGKYSGYIQLYLFNYARLSGLMDKLKPSK